MKAAVLSLSLCFLGLVSSRSLAQAPDVSNMPHSSNPSDPFNSLNPMWGGGSNHRQDDAGDSPASVKEGALLAFLVTTAFCVLLCVPALVLWSIHENQSSAADPPPLVILGFVAIVWVVVALPPLLVYLLC